MSFTIVIYLCIHSQSCHRRGFYCAQGLVNLNYCGDDDGGLMVLKGSNQLVEEFFNQQGRDSYLSWGPFDWHGESPSSLDITDVKGI
jgi:hypothetical protein